MPQKVMGFFFFFERLRLEVARERLDVDRDEEDLARVDFFDDDREELFFLRPELPAILSSGNSLKSIGILSPGLDHAAF